MRTSAAYSIRIHAFPRQSKIILQLRGKLVDSMVTNYFLLLLGEYLMSQRHLLLNGQS